VCKFFRSSFDNFAPDAYVQEGDPYRCASMAVFGSQARLVAPSMRLFKNKIKLQMTFLNPLQRKPLGFDDTGKTYVHCPTD
jgi:hypothetical protein